MTPARRLDGRRALITGAASGIGAASARCFASEGAAVVVADVNAELGAEVVREIQASGGEAHFMRADVTDRDACRRMVTDGAACLGGLDILFNNACALGPGDTEDATWNATLDSGLGAIWAASMTAVPHLSESGKGAIVSTGSVAGACFGYSTPGYSAAKAGVVGITRWLAKNLGPKGIRANCICPGLPHRSALGRNDTARSCGHCGRSRETRSLSGQRRSVFHHGPGHCHRRGILCGPALRSSCVNRTSPACR